MKIFEVVEERDNYIYYIVNLDDPISAADLLFDDFFSEETLFNHFKYLAKVSYEPSQRNYIDLYQNLSKFLSDSDCSIAWNREPEEIAKIIESEEAYFDGASLPRDKIGKIGEYFLNVLLEKYFGYELVLNKMKFLTNRNMSIYGIDTIHYSSKTNSLFFGEAKLTSNLINGISLINESLKVYEDRILNEISLHFTIDNADNLNLPKEFFEDAINQMISPKDFLVNAKVDTIYIPLFIAHGNEISKEDILSELDKIPRNCFLGKETRYIVISMPLIDSAIFAARIYEKINKKCLELEENGTKRI